MLDYDRADPNMATRYRWAKADVDRLRGLLRRYEWAGDNQGVPVCPECGGQRDYEGHADDCELDKELRDE